MDEFENIENSYIQFQYLKSILQYDKIKYVLQTQKQFWRLFHGDVLPSPTDVVVLWFFSVACVCRLQCIGRVSQRLHSRSKHVLPKILQGNYFADRITNTYGSSIAEYLINNRNCSSFFNADLFTILSKCHSDDHRKVLETIHILTHKPSLCRQGECLLGLNLISI